MSWQEKIERLKDKELVKRAEERRIQNLEKERREREVQEKKERLLKALESRKIPEMMAELNKECLGGRGNLSCYSVFLGEPQIRLTLDWDDDNYIRVEGELIKEYRYFILDKGTVTTKIELTLKGYHFTNITNLGRDSLEEAIAKAFLHPGSHEADAESYRRSMSP